MLQQAASMAAPALEVAALLRAGLEAVHKLVLQQAGGLGTCASMLADLFEQGPCGWQVFGQLWEASAHAAMGHSQLQVVGGCFRLAVCCPACGLLVGVSGSWKGRGGSKRRSCGLPSCTRALWQSRK